MNLRAGGIVPAGRSANFQKYHAQQHILPPWLIDRMKKEKEKGQKDDHPQPVVPIEKAPTGRRSDSGEEMPERGFWEIELWSKKTR